MVHCALSSRARCFLRFAAIASLALAGALHAAPAAWAEPIGNGPVLNLGYSGDQDASSNKQSLAVVSVGWRWRWDGPDMIDNLMEKAKIDFSFAVEPLVGVLLGDAQAFEASLVPYIRLQPLGWEGVVPYFEGGVGIAYIGLRNYGLGSSAEFSDNVGFGVTIPTEGGRRWSIGYRFRHMSHAGLLSEHNDGLNVHFLTLTVE